MLTSGSPDDYQPCSNYRDILSGHDLIEAEAVQSFSAELRRTGTQECFKFIREDLKVTVKGHIFTGAHEFYQPMDDSDCK